MTRSATASRNMRDLRAISVALRVKLSPTMSLRPGIVSNLPDRRSPVRERPAPLHANLCAVEMHPRWPQPHLIT